jgi:hypothetical protein
MRKISFRFIPCFIIWLLLASPALGQKLSLRFTGGAGFPSLDHINQPLKDFEEFYRTRGELSENWTFIQGRVKELNSVIELEGELLYRFSSRFALGLGIGYFYSEVTEEKTTLELQYKDDPQQLYTSPTKIYALPLTASAYTFFRLSSKIQIYVKAGGGLIWATHVRRLGDKEISHKDFSYTLNETASAQGSILYGGLGISIELDRGMSFLIEGNMRRSKISGFTGQITIDRTGSLYYYEEYESGVDIWLAQNKILEKEPSGDDIRAVEETVVDLSGLSFKIGIIVRF